MNKKRNNCTRASAFPITFISLLTVLLTLGAAAVKNQCDRGPAGTSVREVGMLQKKSLTRPAGLKPVEQQAWLAMARRRRNVSDGVGGPNWVTTGSMGTARAEHTAMLLQSGKALVAGGLGS